jgi:hypothetical protein
MIQEWILFDVFTLLCVLIWVINILIIDEKLSRLRNRLAKLEMQLIKLQVNQKHEKR